LQKDRSYKLLHQVADEKVAELTRLILEQFYSKELEAALTKLSSSVDIGDEDQIWTALDIDAFLDDLRIILISTAEKVVEGGYSVGVKNLVSHIIDATVDTHGTITTTIDGKPVQLSYGFNVRNPYAQEYIQTSTGKLIKDISKETQSAIKQILSDAFKYGGSPKEQARAIKELIGLSLKDQNLLTKYRDSLISHGLTSDEVDKFVEEYRNKKLTARAEMIARTETIDASNEGQRIAWIQALEDGLLNQNWVREWVVTPDDRLCPFCQAMSGQTASIKGEFISSISGEKITGPTLHPLCRCVTKLKEQVVE
jgi:hypothetical protein